MAKELTHRGDDLKQLGWSQQDVLRYIDLWDYRQRWGAINLEREDRRFLRKAEAALPEIKTYKTSVKKPIRQKSYYCRLLFFLDQMRRAEESFQTSSSSTGLWPIVLEEELRALDYFQPVLGLPDTLKAKLLIPFREELLSSLQTKFKVNIQNFEFDFNVSLDAYNASEKKNWKPLRDGVEKDLNLYPVISSEVISECRSFIRKELVQMIRKTFPSLAEFDKPDPSDEWIPESNS
ncbi:MULTISPECIES: hypothetical protein [unclassified Prochlorococcus]|uniref:hypothetical protein n=1 Tax=unclassified Prochlorococcus TaxID=2627481 RepID=UPI0005337E43|nr:MULTISPECIES: hypothetical protein [unclassified Prochlorococcus]KGG15114.1 hypothetical protein EV06_0979 [Prochlorococcus sp. MIT 0602]KGG17386.1 hypothetical protein EV07_0825 [Prochlorococcus sp. MIT 0603]